MFPATDRKPNRRRFLKTLAAAGAGCAFNWSAPGQTASTASREAMLLTWLETHRRTDGGYGWTNQQRGHLTPSFAAVGCYRLFNRTPPGRDALVRFLRAHHPAQLKRLEQEHRQFEWQQIQSLLWLGEDVSGFADQVRGWRKPTVYLKQYEQSGNPVLASEITAFTCRALLGLPAESITAGYVSYLEDRRRTNGSFNNSPATEGGDGHILNTWWGLQGLQVLGRDREKAAETTKWLQACQRPDGGFTWQPGAEFAAVDDVTYTWAGVRALDLIGAKPLRVESCIRYLLALYNQDGGFSDRPGWLSNPLASYRALDALGCLGVLNRLSSHRPASVRRRKLPSGLKVFSAQIEAHGQGSPVEAVDLAGSLGIHLWGAKNAKAGWIARAQEIARNKRVPVTFFRANEEYGTWVKVNGLGTYSHTSDLIAPADTDIGPSLANQGVVSWAEFRERRLNPLQKGGGALVWQFGENEELVRLYLDDSLERGGYTAISTYHFGNPDFTNSEPFLHRYNGQIPFVALQDAHGEEPWWFADMTAGFRTLFLGKEPTWEAWQQALKENWIAAVRHDEVSADETWMHGRREVLDFMRRNEIAWRWWNNPSFQRPLVSVVNITAEDPFEAARPEQGLSIRVRCAFGNTTQGRPKTPLAELVKLQIDGREVSPTLVAPKPSNGAFFADHYHLFHDPQPTPGDHRAEATVRNLKTGQLVTRQLNYAV